MAESITTRKAPLNKAWTSSFSLIPSVPVVSGR
jgi:hypothetical protein